MRQDSDPEMGTKVNDAYLDGGRVELRWAGENVGRVSCDVLRSGDTVRFGPWYSAFHFEVCRSSGVGATARPAGQACAVPLTLSRLVDHRTLGVEKDPVTRDEEDAAIATVRARLNRVHALCGTLEALADRLNDSALDRYLLDRKDPLVFQYMDERDSNLKQASSLRADWSDVEHSLKAYEAYRKRYGTAPEHAAEPTEAAGTSETT